MQAETPDRRDVAGGLLSRLTGRTAAEMPFLDHLDELRRVLLASLAAILLCAIVAWAFSARVLEHVVQTNVGEAQFLRPMEAFNSRLKVSLLLGTVVALPFVSFQLWSFIVPGLMRHERRIVLPIVTASTILFLGGMAFSYLVLTPIMLQMLVGMGTEHLKANIAVEPLIDFVLKLAFGAGILFQLPLVILILTSLRIVSARWVWSKWRHAIVIILIIAAVVTPGDGPSQLVLAAPILVLYFLSALTASVIEAVRRPRKDDGRDTGRKETP